MFGQRAQEAQSQGEEEQEAQLRVVGPDKRCFPVSEEDERHGSSHARSK